jgi:hypothetical protein
MGHAFIIYVPLLALIRRTTRISALAGLLKPHQTAVIITDRRLWVSGVGRTAGAVEKMSLSINCVPNSTKA